MIRRLRCYIVGHRPELVSVDRRGGLEWWDCAGRCGWTATRRVDPRRVGLIPYVEATPAVSHELAMFTLTILIAVAAAAVLIVVGRFLS